MVVLNYCVSVFMVFFRYNDICGFAKTSQEFLSHKRLVLVSRILNEHFSLSIHLIVITSYTVTSNESTVKPIHVSKRINRTFLFYIKELT